MVVCFTWLVQYFWQDDSKLKLFTKYYKNIWDHIVLISDLTYHGDIKYQISCVRQHRVIYCHITQYQNMLSAQYSRWDIIHLAYIIEIILIEYCPVQSSLTSIENSHHINRTFQHISHIKHHIFTILPPPQEKYQIKYQTPTDWVQEFESHFICMSIFPKRDVMRNFWRDIWMN